MITPCLNINITRVCVPLEISISEICGMNLNFIPLFVEEGYLIVDYRDSEAVLFVQKK